MKKALLILVLVAIAVLPATANTTLVNLAYNVHNDIFGFSDLYDGLHLRSVGLSITGLNADDFGFYGQANPYYGLSFKNVSVAKLSDYDEMLIGSNFLLGYGGDFNFGPMGLLIGGGLFLDLNYYDFGTSWFNVTAGLGLGANVYFQPGMGNLVVNAGLTAAISPWGYWIYDGGSEDYTNWGMTTINLNVGVGWRTGGQRERDDRSSYDDGDDDW